MVIEFLPAIVVLYKTPAFRLDGVVVQSVGDQGGAFPLPCWVLQKWLEALPIQTFPFGQTAKVDKRRINIYQADRPMAQFIFRHAFMVASDLDGNSKDKWCPR